MMTWTHEKRTLWKETLKQMIKSSGQTQVDVAKEMARRVSFYEGTKVVESSFVAPLSRFVNAKGNEITRWFELPEERLLPLAQALRLSSIDPLILAHQQILLGETIRTIHHPAFPTVEWDIDWTKCFSPDRRYLNLDEFTLLLLSQSHVGSPIESRWWKGGQVLQVPWSMIQKAILTENLKHALRDRIQYLPESIWSICRMGLSDALWWLHDLLHHDALWVDGHLISDWLTHMQSIWATRLFSGLSQQSRVLNRLNSDQMQIWANHLWSTMNPMGVSKEDWLEQSTWSGLSTGNSVGLSNEIWMDLRSTDLSTRESALRELEDWTRPLTSERFLDDALKMRLIVQDEGCLFLRDPWVWLPIMDWKRISIPESLCVSELWYPVLSWKLAGDDSKSLQVLMMSKPQSWWIEDALTWLWVVSSVAESEIQIDESIVRIGTLSCSQVDIIRSWLNLMRLAQSRLIFGSKLVAHFHHAEIIRRYHLFSHRLCSILPSSEMVLNGESLDISQTILEQYSPYQSVFRSKKEWLEQQKRASFPIWKILERRAECDDIESATLLATTRFQSGEQDCAPPLELQLHWLARIPTQTNHLVLFQQRMVEYWSGVNPSLPLVLQVAEDIGFDTVLNWMGGWMNPLYWLQNPEEAQTLSRLSISFAVHFEQYDLLEQWLFNLWDWLRLETSVESGFAIWNGRRVPVQSVNIELVEELMVDVLSIGVQQCSSSSLALAMAKHTHELPDGDRLYAACRQIKELLLQQFNIELCILWIQSAPRVDLDIERVVLQVPELLNTLWRIDDQQNRRTDILRLAALLPSIPMWAVREAEKIVYRTKVWPNWLSPFSPEIAHLIPHMMQGKRLIDRTWWARVFFKHSHDLSETWPMLLSLFQQDVQSFRSQTVHFLSPDSTPLMDCDDLLRWISSIQRELPVEWMSHNGLQFKMTLLQYWRAQATHLSESQLFMMLSILSKDVPMQELLSLTTVEQFWSQLSASGRQVLLNNWLSCQSSDELIRVIDHPLVGSAVLHTLFISGHPIVQQRILVRIAQGDFSILDMAMQYELSTSELIQTIEVALENGAARSILNAWLIRNARKWQDRDIHWHVWVRNLLGQV